MKKKIKIKKKKMCQLTVISNTREKYVGRSFVLMTYKGNIYNNIYCNIYKLDFK